MASLSSNPSPWRCLPQHPPPPALIMSMYGASPGGPRYGGAGTPGSSNPYGAYGTRSTLGAAHAEHGGDSYVQSYIFGGDERTDEYNYLGTGGSGAPERRRASTPSRSDIPYRNYSHTPDRAGPLSPAGPVPFPLDRTELTARGSERAPANTQQDILPPPSADIYEETASTYLRSPMASRPTDTESSVAIYSTKVEATSTWITIFGFPTRDSTVIMRHFQEFGDIVQHIIPSGAANWIHVQYQTPSQALRALGKNGKFVAGYMVGVVTASDKDRDATARLSAPAQINEEYNPFLRAPNLPNSSSVQGSGTGPKMPTSAWSRFFEYVFGW
eukprot:TRINITY_DN7375_c0_g1_i3.p1 TRINITY_DN7375_c0_g1~~TRINITY_DN7375_c0_g1_i3.p1  ORF type:complete len:329 (+),score=34.49 TRINITY_DN7375_c0_g1_i3:482-1468(+)